MKKRIMKLLAVVIAIILLLGFIDINGALSQYVLYRNLKSNVNFIIKVLNKSLPLLVIIIIFIGYKVLSNKWVFRIEKFNLGGVSVICNNPEDIFKQQVKNFLNTKRTLFQIDEKRDNFYDTINSYYQVYNFLRDEIKIYDIESSKKSFDEKSKIKKWFHKLNSENEESNTETNCYKKANKMIKELNEFLTSHQSDFRRWYEYLTNNEMSKIYNKRIYDIQKDYGRYDEIVEDFKKVNKFFCSVASEFEIDYEKWNKPEKSCGEE